ncbi:hypothetical protein BH11CYA1_BH11CYA1_02730 [soil metagenome]
MTGLPIIFIVCLGSAIIAMGGFALTRKLIKPIDIGEHQTFLDAMFNIVGTLVSLILGLLVAASLEQYQDLERSIDSEASSVAEVYRLSRGLPEPSRTQIQNLCQRYCQLVVSHEWPAMAKGKASPEVFETFCMLNDESVLFRPNNDGESNIQSYMLETINSVGEGRRERMLSLTNTRQQLLGPVLLVGALIVFVFAFFYVKQNSLFHTVVIAFVAIALGGNLALIYLLSKPFEGEWKIQPRPFLLNINARQRLKDSTLLDPVKARSIPFSELKEPAAVEP